jgi:hypothetical protein
MDIYIQKKGQQIGPFNPAKVLAGLESGELSPQDLARLRGKKWLPLKSLLPVIRGEQDLETVYPPKSKLSTGLSIGLGLVLTIGAVGSFFAIQHSNQQQKERTAEAYRQRQDADIIATKNIKGPDYYKAFKEKAIAIPKLKLTLAPSDNAKIKGKVLIFLKRMKDIDYYSMIGLENRDSESLQKFISQDDDNLKDLSLTFQDLADNLEDLETVIQIECNSSEDPIGQYGGSTGGKMDIPAYANLCQVSIIDYKAKTIVAQATFENDQANETASVTKDQLAVVLPPPTQKIRDYIKSLRSSK